ARARGTAPLPARPGTRLSVLLAGLRRHRGAPSRAADRAPERGRGDRPRRRRGRADLPRRAVPSRRRPPLGAGPLPAGARRGRCGGTRPALRTAHVRSAVGATLARMEPSREDVLKALEQVIDPELRRPVTELD